MREFSQILWRRIRELGITAEMPYLEQVRVRILNQQTFYVLAMLFILVIKTMVELEEDIWLSFSLLLFTVPILLFNYWRRYVLARLYWVVMIPLAATAIVFLYGTSPRIETIHFVTLVSTLIFFDSVALRNAIVLYIIGLILISLYVYLGHVSTPYMAMTDLVDRILIYVLTVLCVGTIISEFNKEIKSYIGQLERKNQNLLAANKEIERFAYISSHNLKTPVRTIKSFADLIEREVKRSPDPVPQAIPEYLAFIQDSAAQMNLLITDILELSSINHKPIEYAPVSLQTIVQNLERQLLSSHSDRAIRILYDGLPVVSSNATLLMAVFQNLLENAIKYNESPEVRIQIGVSFAPGKVRISVTDNGIGIAAAYHEQIFEMFERLHTQRQYAGSGIGLALCKKVLARLGGHITLNSTEGRGSTFFVELPHTSPEGA